MEEPTYVNELHQVTISGENKNCFIVMPYGKTPEEIQWFQGWYEVVIRPTIIEAGYIPILSSAEEKPSAINDEIRMHLAYDKMVIVDLGGLTPSSEPNPNVMYELGIRHTLGLPLVLMAWKGQQLPFDVHNQRVIMEERDFLHISTNKKKLSNFIKAAEQGSYYKPMEAVGRTATLEAFSRSSEAGSVLKVLIDEVRYLKEGIIKKKTPYIPQIPNIQRLLSRTTFKKGLYQVFISAGGTQRQWNRFLKVKLPDEILAKVTTWNADDWNSYTIEQAQLWRATTPIQTLTSKEENAENILPDGNT